MVDPQLRLGFRAGLPGARTWELEVVLAHRRVESDGQFRIVCGSLEERGQISRPFTLTTNAFTVCRSAASQDSWSPGFCTVSSLTTVCRTDPVVCELLILLSQSGVFSGQPRPARGVQPESFCHLGIRGDVEGPPPKLAEHHPEPTHNSYNDRGEHQLQDCEVRPTRGNACSHCPRCSLSALPVMGQDRGEEVAQTQDGRSQSDGN